MNLYETFRESTPTRLTAASILTVLIAFTAWASYDNLNYFSSCRSDDSCLDDKKSENAVCASLLVMYLSLLIGIMSSLIGLASIFLLREYSQETKRIANRNNERGHPLNSGDNLGETEAQHLISSREHRLLARGKNYSISMLLTSGLLIPSVAACIYKMLTVTTIPMLNARAQQIPLSEELFQQNIEAYQIASVCSIGFAGLVALQIISYAIEHCRQASHVENIQSTTKTYGAVLTTQKTKAARHGKNAPRDKVEPENNISDTRSIYEYTDEDYEVVLNNGASSSVGPGNR